MDNVKDVTDLVEFGNSDDECLPIYKCVCGKTFEPWEFIISIYGGDMANECEVCHRKLFFRSRISVYLVGE